MYRCSAELSVQYDGQSESESDMMGKVKVKVNTLV